MIRPLVCLLALALAAPADAAKTLIVNANGYTLEDDGKVRRFSTLLVGDDGKVQALLSRGASEPKLEQGDYRLDVKGQTMLPGLIDAHVHLMGFGHWLRELDLSSARSLAEAQARIASRIGAVHPAAWLTGRGWDESLWAGGALPTAADLDAVVADRPAWLMRADGEAGWANSAALKHAGITARTEDPAGGRIVRDGRGQPTGVLFGRAMELVARHVAPPSAGEAEKALEAALSHLASMGLTGVHDMGVTSAAWALYRAFGDDGRLTVRVTGYAAGTEAMEAISPLRPTPWLYEERLRLQGVKFVADGSLKSRTAYLSQPYADEPKSRGATLIEDVRLKNLFSRANYLGYQIAVHAVGDAAAAQVLDAFAEIRPTYGDELRNRIEHAAMVSPADIGRLAELKLTVSIQPAATMAGRAMAKTRLGIERLVGADVWNSLDQAGVKLAFGSATPPQPVSRYAATGRLVELDHVASIGDAPSRNLDRLLHKHGADIKGYLHVSNAVEQGQPPRLVRTSDQDLYGPVGDRGQGVSAREQGDGREPRPFDPGADEEDFSGLTADVAAANPFIGIQAAVTRQNGQALSLEQAIAGYSNGAAWAGRMEAKVGQLGEGYWADFILLDRDPFKIPASELPQVQVTETWLAGARVFQRKN